MYRAVIAFILSCVVPAAAAAQASPPKPAGGGNCLGVLSHIGDKFTVRKVGITVFQNEENEAPIESWRIDDLVVGKVSAFFGKRVNVKRINAPTGAFAPLEERNPFRNYEAELAAVVRNATSPSACDRYVVVTKRGDTYGTTNQTLSGLGIVEGGGLLTRSVDLYAYTSLRLYDGRSFAVLQHRWGTLGQRAFMTAMRGPHREVDESWWPRSSDVAQDARLRDATRALLGQSLDVTLPQLLAE
jgi:hypothetical protein